MLRSMTGFGSTMGNVNGIEYAVEVRSVNNRYFKPVLKLPESWGGAEVEIEQLLRKNVYRGSVTLTVRMRLPDDRSACRVNTAALTSYIDQLKGLEIEANPTMRIDIGSLLLLPGVCEQPPVQELIQSTHDELLALSRRPWATWSRCVRSRARPLRMTCRPIARLYPTNWPWWCEGCRWWCRSTRCA